MTINYADARRRARQNFGSNADVEYAAKAAFPFRIGVRIKGRLHYVGVGSSWEAAFEDAEAHRRKHEYVTANGLKDTFGGG